ncbi:hypothetical protein BU17DRAFT_72427 [Hysterangium stoloniferum]|nr:hypothetical protein BU17DRAFT_72427 [Hysterangium stoloniferum]
MTKTTLKQNPNLQPPKDSVSPRQIISPQGLPPTSHRRVLKTRAAPARYSFEWPFVSVLDPVLHTVRNVYERDPFLLTVSCIEHNGRHYCALSVKTETAYKAKSSFGYPK